MKKKSIDSKIPTKRPPKLKKSSTISPRTGTGRKKSPHKKLPKIILGIAILLAILLLIAGLKSPISSHFRLDHRLKSVDFSNDGSITKGFIIRELNLKKNQELGEIDVRKIRQHLLQFSQIREAKIRRIYPHQLSIQLQERTPILRIYDENERKYRYLSSDGSIFDYNFAPKLDLDSLPILEGVTVEAKRLPIFIPLGVEVCQFYRQAQQCQPEIVSQWRTIFVDEEAYQLNHQLDMIEVRMNRIHHLLLRISEIPQQMEKLAYILEEARSKHLFPLVRVDLTIDGHAYIKPLKTH